MKDARAYQGFTLLELSIVLVVIAVITGMGALAGLDIRESTRRTTTQTKMDVLENALMQFRIKYGRLPCPASATLATSDSNYGIEAANNVGTCTGGTPAATYLTTTTVTGVPSGAVPTRTLGLPDEFMYDGWGRKFRYEVTPAMTRDNAFLYSSPADSCSITIKDNSDTALGTNAVYALVSHGKNGIGGYDASGNLFSDATVSGTISEGTDETTNIHHGSYTTEPTFRIKNSVTGVIGDTSYYDDIVRFKWRSQLMDYNDRNTAVYKGPEMALGHDATSSTQLVYGKPTCNQWKKLTVTTSSIPSQEPRFLAFTPSNTNLVAYYDGNCKIYSISSTTLTALTDFTTCPAAATKGAMAQTSGTLALNDTASPYVRVYKMSGSGSTAVFTEINNALSPALTYAPTNITLSANAEYLTVSKSGSTPALYSKNSDNTYQAVSPLPGTSYTEYSTAISPDGRYYAIAEVSGSDTNIYMYRNVGGTFTQMGTSPGYIVHTATGIDEPDFLRFSPDSSYLAIAEASADKKLNIAYINPTTEAASTALSVTHSRPIRDVAFSKDSAFFATAQNGTLTYAVSFYRRVNSTAFNSTEETTGFVSGDFHASAATNAIALAR